MICIFDCKKLTIILYCNQEQFNVIAISFKNLSLYIQRQIDIMLRFYPNYVKAYIDNIIIFSKTLDKYLQIFCPIFLLVDFKNITFLSKKSFLEYLTIILFNQQVDTFDLIAIVNKIDAIKSLDFFYTLTNLEFYLRLTKYFRDYVFFYAQKTKIL